MINAYRAKLLPQPSQTIESGYWNAAIPPLCIVPIQQHVGSELKPYVSVGDQVREGMVIAGGSHRLAVPLHAPVPGIVREIGSMNLLDGSSSEAIVIELSGEFDRLGKVLERYPWVELSPGALLTLVRDGGVLSLGRSGLPLHVELTMARSVPDPRLILSVARNEPYLQAEAELIIQNAAEVLEGLAIVARILESTEVAAIVSRRYTGAWRALRRAVQEQDRHRKEADWAEPSSRRLRMQRITDGYPVHLDEQLSRLAFGRQETNVLVVDPATAHAVFEAVVYRKPVIDRVITVAGTAVPRAAHVRVRLGTPIRDVLQECGGLLTPNAKILSGGPLTGYRVTDQRMPVTKLTSAVLALEPDAGSKATVEACIGCSVCSRACPAGLHPIYLRYLLADKAVPQAIEAGLMRCVECGLCSYVCPARIPLATVIRHAAEQERVRYRTKAAASG